MEIWFIEPVQNKIKQIKQNKTKRDFPTNTGSYPGGGGDSHIDMVYVYVPAFWGTFSRNLV